MLTKVERKDIPDPGGRERSEMRVFALKALEEFAETAEVGDIVEVTGFPVVCDGEVVNDAKFLNALRTEYWYLHFDGDIRRFRRGGRVFLERVKERELKYVRQD